VSPGKKKKRPARGSFLTRLLGGDKSGGEQGGARKGKKPAGNGAATGKVSRAGKAGPGDQTRARALTPLERSIQEIKHMAKVGQSDPERLAVLLSNLLAGERARRQQDQQKLDRMVSDLLDRRESGEGPPSPGP